jgi:hypothetical protein
MSDELIRSHRTGNRHHRVTGTAAAEELFWSGWKVYAVSRHKPILRRGTPSQGLDHVVDSCSDPIDGGDSITTGSGLTARWAIGPQRPRAGLSRSQVRFRCPPWH